MNTQELQAYSDNYVNPLTKDIIIGSILNYQPKDVACWINSIRETRFTGDVIVINFGCPPDTIDFLYRRGVRVFNGLLNDSHIVVQRFIAMYTILHTLSPSDYRCIFATDVKDVIFNQNPSNRFKDHNKRSVILASTENIQYNNEEWGNNNLKVSYPHMYEFMRWSTIYNAGTISGEFELMRDLFLHIYHLSLIGGDPQPDQAAYNILLATKPFTNSTYFCDDADAWVANLGTTLDPAVKDKYYPYWLDPAPTFKDHHVFNADGKEFYIVHQYDRVPGLKEAVEKRFGYLD